MMNDSSLQTRPLKDLSELYAWQEEELGGLNPAPLAKRSELIFSGDCGRQWSKLRPLTGSELPVGRTLVCHDYKGGYLDDRFCHGNKGCSSLPYVPTLWSAMDYFVYFSHHFISPPPLGWISAGHRHGVKVLGTIITEWDHGAELCRQILGRGKEERNVFVNACVELADKSGFDGWLLNIENPLNGLTEEMVALVREMTEAMHKRVPGSLVLWYDSVTIQGNLDWQNELNNKNCPFFDACDGIFLNYTWKVPSTTPSPCCNDHNSLSNSVDHLRRKKEPGRIHDIYVGVDAFGRGCLGGGGFNCSEAFNAIRDHNLSVALFAPGWTHETANDPNDPVVISARESAFWHLLKKKLYLRCLKLVPGKGPGCLFSSRFEKGFGTAGNNKWWLDMSTQGLQTSFPQPYLQWPPEAKTLGRFQDCYNFCTNIENGRGAQLAANVDDGSDVVVPLLLCEIPCGRDKDLDLIFACGTESVVDFRVGLRVMSPDGTCQTEILEVSDARNDLARLVMEVETEGETLYFPYRLRRGWTVIAVAVMLQHHASLILNFLSICHR